MCAYHVTTGVKRIANMEYYAIDKKYNKGSIMNGEIIALLCTLVLVLIFSIICIITDKKPLNKQQFKAKGKMTPHGYSAKLYKKYWFFWLNIEEIICTSYSKNKLINDINRWKTNLNISEEDIEVL